MSQENFDEDDLELCEWQYIIYNEITDFKKGDIVFLKSNPEFPLIIIDLITEGKDWIYDSNVKDFVFKDDWKVVTCHLKKINDINTKYHRFPPACVLKYSDSVLIEYKRKFKVCLN